MFAVTAVFSLFASSFFCFYLEFRLHLDTEKEENRLLKEQLQMIEVRKSRSFQGLDSMCVLEAAVQSLVAYRWTRS